MGMGIIQDTYDPHFPCMEMDSPGGTADLFHPGNVMKGSIPRKQAMSAYEP
jgi:hypothetical protein